MTRQAPTLSSIYENDSKFGWLDTVSEQAQHNVHRLFRASAVGMKIKSVLNGTPFRHRMHPAIIIVPLGAWTTAVVFDALEGMSSGDDRLSYRKGADASVALGLVGALPATVTGLADWVDLYDHRRRVGMAHALLNSAAWLCFSGSLALRVTNGDRRGAARALSGIGYGLVMMGGALGGDLVYTLGVNVPHTTYPKPPNEFTDVLASDELVEGAPVVIEVERVPVLLVRHGETIHAVDAWCPHAGGPLGDGTFDGDVVECPWHQSRFCLKDGKPLQGPAATPLRTFDVREEAGRISVSPSYEGQSWPPPPDPPASGPKTIQA
jgi:nitrite reductase/ring-hydroxylating ferredoxin subunit/uncharacterized membrane protein